MILHRNARSTVRDIVGEVDQELCETAFRGGVVAENRGEGGVSERFGETLSQSLARAAVITETGREVSEIHL